MWLGRRPPVPSKHWGWSSVYSALGACGAGPGASPSLELAAARPSTVSGPSQCWCGPALSDFSGRARGTFAPREKSSGGREQYSTVSAVDTVFAERTGSPAWLWRRRLPRGAARAYRPGDVSPRASGAARRNKSELCAQVGLSTRRRTRTAPRAGINQYDVATGERGNPTEVAAAAFAPARHPWAPSRRPRGCGGELVVA